MFYDHNLGHAFLHTLRATERHGHGGRRGGFGRGGFGGDGVPGGRRLGSEDLQLVLLFLLADQDRHGYELIRIIGERSGGFYEPSPGMVYPALTFLAETGLAAATADGNRKSYAITDAGRVHLDTGRARAESILDTLGRIGRRMDGVRDAFRGVDDPDPDAAEELHRARHALKDALGRTRGCSPAETRRIARILQEAAHAIGASRA